MFDSDLSDLVRQGNAALARGNTLEALFLLEEAAGKERAPLVLSSLGYCLAKERGEMARAFALCGEAIRRSPANTTHYLHLGRIHLLAGQRHLALAAFRKGLKFGRQQELIDEIRKMGLRRPPLFASLGRQHPLNKYLGLVFSRLGLR